MNRYEFFLQLSPEQCLDYYRGKVRRLLVRSTGGQIVQFPASRLQRFFTKEGVKGPFVLTCDEHHKCIDLERMDAIK